MRMVIQRVSRASVTIEGDQVAGIGKGLLILLGIETGDSEAVADKMLDKALKLRIFEDAGGKTNLSLADVEGEVLIVSQFTLYADVSRGNRPGFTNAAKPEPARRLYEYVLAQCCQRLGRVGAGRFGADMKVELLNDGPFTILLDSKEILS